MAKKFSKGGERYDASSSSESHSSAVSSTNSSRRGSTRNGRGSTSRSDVRAGDVGANSSRGSFGAINPPYALTPVLQEMAASLPFGRALGSQTDFVSAALLSVGAGTISNESVPSTFPGIMTLSWLPTIGISEGPTSPVSLAGRKLYYFVRHANSGHVNYDAPDLTNYIVAADSAFFMFSYFRRALGMLNTFSPLNRYYAQYAMESAGFDYDDLFHNAAELNFFLNQTAAKMRSLVLPKSIAYYQRHSALSDNIYADADDARAQTYQFVPAGWYVWTEPTSGDGANTKLWSLSFHPNPGITYAASSRSSENESRHSQRPDRGKLLTLADMREIMDGILEPLLLSEDFNIMSGDILKAFGSDVIVGVSEVPIGYTIAPVYDEDALDQIRNAIILTLDVQIDRATGSTPDKEFDIVQEDGLYLYYSPRYLCAELFVRKPILDYAHGMPSPGRNLAATRFTVSPRSIYYRPAQVMRNEGGGTSASLMCELTFSQIGTEVISSAWTSQIAFEKNGAGVYQPRIDFKSVRSTNPVLVINGTVTDTLTQYYARLASVTRTAVFHSHPQQYIAAAELTAPTPSDEAPITTATAITTKPIGFIGDFTNYCVLERSDVEKMHEAAVLALFFQS
nr:MAG TPA: capsid [Picobirnaviridae sp.]